MSAPLCPWLYERLQLLFGEVRVSNEGQAISPHWMPDPFGSTDKRTLEDTGEGEYYRVMCPYCGDLRRRLYVSYLWGEYPRLVRCFNETLCMGREEYREDLRLRVLGSAVGRVRLPVLAGEEARPELVRVEPPGLFYRLTTLGPSHSANQYLAARGFEPTWLETQAGVGYCAGVRDTRHRSLEGRLYVPFVFRGQLVGWQGRLVGEPPKKGWPFKYFTMPGFARRLYLYNFDRAVRRRTVVLVEGVTSAWGVLRACSQAGVVATLGMVVSQAQAALLAGAWGARGGALVLCFDPEVDPEEKQVRLDGLRQAFDNRVAVVKLPAGVDPGSCAPELLKLYLEEAAARAGGSLEATWEGQG